MTALSERAARVHAGQVNASDDNMLCITADGRKIGLDQRLMNPLLPDDPGSKLNACVSNVLRIWEEGRGQRLPQMIFCDLSTPNGLWCRVPLRSAEPVMRRCFDGSQEPGRTLSCQ